jgi:hypothetical protein
MVVMMSQGNLALPICRARHRRDDFKYRNCANDLEGSIFIDYIGV